MTTAPPTEQELRAQITSLIAAAERALGDHVAPHDCYATGPLTGNPIADLIACPGCGQQAEIAAARKLLSTQPSRPQGEDPDWRPISEAPKDGTHIILAFGQDHSSEGWWVDDDSEPRPWCFIDIGDCNEVIINRSRDGEYGPSHWLPKPSPLSNPVRRRASMGYERATEEATLTAWDDLKRAIERMECSLPAQLTASVEILVVERKRFERLMLGMRPTPPKEA